MRSHATRSGFRTTAPLAWWPLAILACAGDPHPVTPEPTVISVRTEGPGGGTWEARTLDVVCSAGLRGTGTWGVQFTGPGEGLGSLQLLAEEVGPAGTSTAFALTAVLGGFRAGVEHRIETRPTAVTPGGMGRVSVQDSGSIVSLSVQGVSGEGPPVWVEVRCQRPRRLSPS